MKIEMLDVGWFTAPAGIFRAGDDLDRTVRFPVPAYVVETATERILIDTGLNPAAISDPAAYYERPDVFAVTALEQEQSVADQLDVGTLTKVVLTHLHWDHVGGLQLIPASVPVVVQRSEWAAGHDDAAVQRNFFQPRDYAGDGREVILIDGDCDLLGDGSVELLLTPGHTPGHQSVRIGDARARRRRRPLRIGSGRPSLPCLRRRSRAAGTLSGASARAARRRPQRHPRP